MAEQGRAEAESNRSISEAWWQERHAKEAASWSDALYEARHTAERARELLESARAQADSQLQARLDAEASCQRLTELAANATQAWRTQRTRAEAAEARWLEGRKAWEAKHPPEGINAEYPTEGIPRLDPDGRERACTCVELFKDGK